MRTVVNVYRVVCVAAGLSFIGIRASESLLVQALYERMPLEQVRPLIQAADQESLHDALRYVAARNFELQEGRALLMELLQVGEYSQQDLDQALDLAVDAEARELVGVLQEAGADASAILRYAFARSGMVDLSRVQGLADMQLLTDPAEVMELALLNNVDPRDLRGLKNMLFDQSEDFITGLLDRARAQESSELVHKLFEGRMVAPSRVVEYADTAASDWLREVAQARLAEVSMQLPVSSEPTKDFEFPRDDPSEIEMNRKHFPILFLIDQESEEGIDSRRAGEFMEVSVKPVGAIMLRLQALVAWDERLIVASKGLTCGLLALAHERQDEWYSFMREAIDTDWSLYGVPGTQFTVWVPNGYVEYYAEILNLDQFQQIFTGTKEKILAYCPSRLVEKDDPRIQFKKYDVSDLEKIFKSKAPRPRILEDVERREKIKLGQYTEQELKLIFQSEKRSVLDVYLTGHGLSGQTMAGLPVSQDVDERERLTSLLTFLSKKVDTGIVYIQSCSAGGRNISLLQARKDAVPLDYNYILIVGAVSDKSTLFEASVALPVIDLFFSRAAQLGRGGKRLNDLLEGIVELVRVSGSADAHGYAAFPQVWVPGQLGFQGPNVHKDVFAVGNVTAAVYAQMGRALEIKEPLVVLWYPKLFSVPIRVAPASLPDNMLLSLGRRLPTMGELVGTQFLRFMDEVNQEESPVLHTLVGEDRDWTEILNYSKYAAKKLYPDFVLMDKATPRRLWLKHIQLIERANPLMGILRFLRDSFTETGDGAEPKDIFIERLEGINDFPMHMEAARLSAQVSVNDASPLEALLRPTAGQTITLDNVMIRIGEGQLRFYIEYGANYWLYGVPLTDSLDRKNIWNFQKTEPPPIDEFKRALAAYILGPEQETVRKVLEKKLKQLKEATPPE